MSIPGQAPDPVPVNPLKARWRAGEATYGVLVTMPSVTMMQLLALAGFDWTLVQRGAAAILEGLRQ